MKNLLLLIAFCLVLEGAFATPRDFVNVTRIKDSFEVSFVHNTPAKDYVIGVRVSSLNVQKVYHDIELAHNENWSDLCLDVLLKNPLPELLVNLLPAKFYDVRVFYRVSQKDEGEDVICPLIALVCPDGTNVGYTVVDGQCAMVCPEASYPVGGLSYDQVDDILTAFVEAYTTVAPFSEYLTHAEMHTLEEMSHTQNITLGANEKWTDYCLLGDMDRDKIPEDVFFPLVYQGVRVFYEKHHWGCVGCEDIYPYRNVNVSSIIFPVGIFLLVVFVVIGCCIRRRRCQNACAYQASLLKAEQGPVAAGPSEYSVDMFPHPQYEYEMPYDPQELEQPIMFQNGYPAPLAPVFVPQHGWFLPVPVPPQRQ